MVRLSRPVCPAGPDARLPARAVTLLAVLLTLLASSPAQADDTDINHLRLHQLLLILLLRLGIGEGCVRLRLLVLGDLLRDAQASGGNADDDGDGAAHGQILTNSRNSRRSGP